MFSDGAIELLQLNNAVKIINVFYRILKFG